MYQDFLRMGEYAAAGMYEEPHRSLFYRKALGIRRFYENCALGAYRGERLYPSGVLPQSMAVYPHYLRGMNMDYGQIAGKNQALADAFASEFDAWRSSVSKEHTVAGDMWTHSMPNYPRILGEGLLSYGDRINEKADPDFREGLVHVLEGIKAYVHRCVKYLQSVNADPALIQALKKVPLYPATTLYEAVVAWNFVLYLDNCDNLGCVASGLLPYYQGEDAVPLLENLYANLDANNGYSMALGMDYNPLTVQCLEASKGKRRPMIELFVDETTPEAVWQKAFEVVKSGNGQPAFYNPHLILGGLKERFPFIRDEDLKKFCGGGCTETMLAGLSNVGSLDAGINLLLILERVMQEKLEKAADFEALYACYLSEVRSAVHTVCDQISRSQLERARLVPLPMRTLLVDDCVEKGLDFNNNGARYKWSIINFAGTINVIDSLLAIKGLVFDTGTYTASQLLECLAREDEDFLTKARKHAVCFGSDNQEANAFAHRLSDDVFSMLDEPCPALGAGFLPASIQFRSQGEAGRPVGATPDGRCKGAPLCDSLGAIFGKDTQGPTALLKSVTSLQLKKALGIPVLNFNIRPDFDPAILKGIILGYMQLGGMQIQMTCTTVETLQEAYENPDLHRNLVVRVGGYSEYFCVLPDELKRMIINRTIQEMG